DADPHLLLSGTEGLDAHLALPELVEARLSRISGDRQAAVAGGAGDPGLRWTNRKCYVAGRCLCGVADPRSRFYGNSVPSDIQVREFQEDRRSLIPQDLKREASIKPNSIAFDRMVGLEGETGTFTFHPLGKTFPIPAPCFQPGRRDPD